MPENNRMLDNGGNRDFDQPRDETGRETYLTADITSGDETEAEGVLVVVDGESALIELPGGETVAFDATELRHALEDAA